MNTKQLKTWISEASEWDSKIHASKRKFLLLEALLKREGSLFTYSKHEGVIISRYGIEADDRDGIYEVVLHDDCGMYDFEVIFIPFSEEIEELMRETMEEIPF